MFKIERISEDHLLPEFDCGDENKNRFLTKFALQNSKGGFGRTYVAVRSGQKAVLGFYTISSSSVRFENIPSKQNLPRYPIPSILIGKLAVDSSVKGQGLGTALMFDALKRVAEISEEIGIFLVEVKAVDAKAKQFYKRLGFLEMLDNDLKLFMAIKTVRKVLAQIDE